MSCLVRFIEAQKFLRTLFDPNDWTALLLKSQTTGEAVQRVGSMAWASTNQVLEWLRGRNALHYSVYVSVNGMTARARSRTRLDVATVRHVFLDLDQNADGVLGSIGLRSALPSPSYILHTSPNRAHIFWRVRDFEARAVERLQRRLAAELNGDLAATSVTQLTRLPGFWNHKYRDPYMVWVEYGDVERVYTPRDFPAADVAASVRPGPILAGVSMLGLGRRAERARAYLSHVPPAVAGQHGDLRTFQTCCRVARGFALDDDQALAVLADWNARCQPPWTERELLQKVRSARRNGREPIGGLL